MSRVGWDFGAEDGEPIHCVLMLATPDGQASKHLAVLAALARLFITQTDLRDRLVAAATSQEAYELLNSDEAAAVNYAIEARP